MDVLSKSNQYINKKSKYPIKIIRQFHSFLLIYVYTVNGITHIKLLWFFYRPQTFTIVVIVLTHTHHLGNPKIVTQACVKDEWRCCVVVPGGGSKVLG